MKLCKDCNWYFKAAIFNNCTKIVASEHVVTGEKFYYLCETQRQLHSQCGEEALWLEPKPSILGKIKQLFSRRNNVEST